MQIDAASIGGSSNLRLSAIYDNLDNKRSAKIGPHIFYNYGLVTQIEDAIIKDWTFEGAIRNTLPYLSQIGGASLQIPKVQIPIAFREFQQDFWKLFYRRWLLEAYSILDFEFLVFISYRRYLELDIRNRVGFFIKIRI